MEDNIHEVLTTLDGFIKEGKSNILVYRMKMLGIMRFLEENKYHNLPRVKRFKSIFLLNRLFENASAEICIVRM
jgi:hypothetical protein